MTDTITYRLRGSSLPGHHNCARAWAVEHLKRARSKKTNADDDSKNIGAIIGSMCHEAFQRLQVAKMEQVTIDPKKVIDDQIDTMLAKCKGVPLAFDSTTKSLGDAAIQIDSIVTEFYDHVLPTIKPVHVELELLYEYSPLINVECHIDTVDRISESLYAIGDYKTGHGDGAYQAQLGVYLLALEFQKWFRGSISHVWIWHIQRVGPNAAQTAASQIVYTRDQVINAAMRVLEDIEREITEYEQCGTLWPFGPNPSSMFCTESSCPAWGTELCDQWTPKHKKEKRHE